MRQILISAIVAAVVCGGLFLVDDLLNNTYATLLTELEAALTTLTSSGFAPLVTVFDRDAAPQAHHFLEAGRPIGKVVVDWE